MAFPDKADVDRNYVRLMERLMAQATIPEFATHDETIINHAREFARRQDIGNERFEFQMLYGVRRDLQESCAGRATTAGLHPLRHAVVSLPHAPAGGAARQYRLFAGQHHEGVGAGPVSEVTLGGYMANTSGRRPSAAATGRPTRSPSTSTRKKTSAASTGPRCCLFAGRPAATGRSATWRPRRSPGAAPRPKPTSA